MKNNNTRTLVYTALFASIVCVATYMIKIPSVNGYTHLGDCMIFISILILGTRRGALAGGTGAALSDLLGGYTQWIFPTFLIKALMALIMGEITERVFPKYRNGWILGAIIGGLFQIVGYTLVKVMMYGKLMAIVEVPVLTLQTINGLVIAFVIINLLSKSGVMKNLEVYNEKD